MKNLNSDPSETGLSVWWARAIGIILAVEFAVLIWITAGSYYRDHKPPVPEQAVGTDGIPVFTGNDIVAGQQVFLKKALMNNGTIWGHGAYLGPDFSAMYLHELALEAGNFLSLEHYGRPYAELSDDQKSSLAGPVHDLLAENRYDQSTHNLTLLEPERKSFTHQVRFWQEYFSNPSENRGLPVTILSGDDEIRQLTAFFAWTAWASAANVPGRNYSYTNNFPYEPLIMNGPSGAAILWSGLSLITLLAGTALILFFFGRFHYLGWKENTGFVLPQKLPGAPSAVERASLKFFIVAIAVLLFQTLAGGAMAHYFAEPGGFFGIDLSSVFPSNILRTWHLQSAIFWIATAYIGGGLFISSVLSDRKPAGHVTLINVLFIALLILAAGSLLGEYLGVQGLLKKLWFWLGNQGWEYLEIGRGWQVLLAIGLLLWAFLLLRMVRPAKGSEDRELKIIFILTAVAIPFFYLPAFFFGSSTNLSEVDTWRFWIIHLWVEGFFEVFATTMVAILFYKLGLVSKQTATRVIYLDAILFLGAGILGTGHHWYWNGQTTASMALSACFSAMEVVPLILLTLEASDFSRLMRTKTDENGNKLPFPQKWAFYFLIAVGIWNFAGAGIFGFLINLPVISYYEVGTNLTPNHGHAALMGVFGMLAAAFTVFAIRRISDDEHWNRIEKYIKLSFWGLNLGLAGMILLQLFPSGVLQLRDVLANGYWHARSMEFSGQGFMRALAWLRFPADLFFILAGVLPLLYSVLSTWLNMRRRGKYAG